MFIINISMWRFHFFFQWRLLKEGIFSQILHLQSKDLIQHYFIQGLWGPLAPKSNSIYLKFLNEYFYSSSLTFWALPQYVNHCVIIIGMNKHSFSKYACFVVHLKNGQNIDQIRCIGSWFFRYYKLQICMSFTLHLIYMWEIIFKVWTYWKVQTFSKNSNNVFKYGFKFYNVFYIKISTSLKWCNKGFLLQNGQFFKAIVNNQFQNLSTFIFKNNLMIYLFNLNFQPWYQVII
jgi:hypothetical protein